MGNFPYNCIYRHQKLIRLYCTIALRVADGSYTAVAKVDGNRTYVQMMQRLSRESSKHATPPCG